jgi:PPOX class probable F420-dependent enzyme
MATHTPKQTPVTSTNRDLLERAVVAHLATARPDGSLQSNPVWFEWDGSEIRISQVRSRQKVHNMEHDPHVALSLTDPDDPYRYLEVRGVVDRIEPDADRSFIDRLSNRYRGQDYEDEPPGTERVVVHIRPTDSSAMAA